MTTAWKNSVFILLERFDFKMIDILSVAAHDFPMCILISPSIDAILLPRDVKSTNFRDASFNFNMVEYCLKPMNSVLCVHVKTNSFCWLLQTMQ